MKERVNQKLELPFQIFLFIKRLHQQTVNGNNQFRTNHSDFYATHAVNMLCDKISVLSGLPVEKR